MVCRVSDISQVKSSHPHLLESQSIFAGEGGAPAVVSWGRVSVYGAVYPCIRRVSPCIGRKQRVSTQLRVFPVYWSQTRLRAVGRRRTASSTHLPRARIHGPRPNACTGMLRSEAACTIGQIACIWSHSTSVIVAELIVVVVVTSCKARRASTLSSTVGKGVSQRSRATQLLTSALRRLVGVA